MQLFLKETQFLKIQYNLVQDVIFNLFFILLLIYSFKI